MRKYCIFLVCILFHYIARAQVANYEYCYWFDSNIEEKQTGMTDAARWNLQIDVGHLSVALHQLHIQVRDTAGHWSVPYSSYFLKVTSDQSNTLAARYWFDDGVAIETTVTNGVHDIDVSALSPGIHYLHYQVQRADGGYSAVSTAMFLCTMEQEKTLGARYWFDDGAAVDTTVTNGVHDIDVSALSPGLHYLHYQVQRADGGYSAVSTAMFLCTMEQEKTLGARYWFDDGAAIDTTVTNGVQDIDVSALSPGLHYLHYQVQRADGGYSAVSTAMFLCTMEQEKTLGARYWFDDGAAVDTTVTNGVHDIDVSALSPGIHYLHYQVQRADGGYSAVSTAMFLCTMEQEKTLGARYWFDDGAAVETTVTNGVQDIDVSALSPGLHYLHYQVQRADGGYSAVNTAMFVKSRNGDNIVRYDYWVNNDAESLRIKAAQSGDSVYILNDSLDVASYPIHPDAFHFEVTDGIPYIYGKNELHARFYNSSNAFAEDSAMYIDGGSRREVTGILPLHHNSHRTDATPEADSIRWYKLEAYAGNSLNIQVSQPCTVQLFSPEGEELLSVSGEAVTDTFACNIASEGVCYVALHSVTGSDSLTTINYSRGNLKYHAMTYMVDGELYATDSIAQGDSIMVLPEPVKEGYTFSGWSEIPVLMPNRDVVVTGSFAINSYLITYMTNDTVVYHTDSLEYKSAVGVPEAAPVKEGYTFSGWSELPDSMPSHDVTVSAMFTVNKYQVSYMLEGEAWMTDSIAFGAPVVTFDAPTKEGYLFNGWTVVPETMPSHDIVLYGSYRVDTSLKYDLIYMVDGEEYKRVTITFCDSITLEPAPTKEGHTFSGWSEVPETMPLYNVTVTGSFTANKYLVTYTVEDEVYHTDSITYGTSLTAIDAPVKEGYTFSGWSEIPATMPAEDVVITGSFTVNVYQLTYTVDGEVYYTDSIAYDTALEAIDAPTKEGYTFSGWSEVPETMPLHDVTVTGSFTVNRYQITYIVDGEISHTDSINYGTELTAIADPVKEGYTFSGWSEVPETMPAEDVVITGGFTVNEYLLTYTVDGEVYYTDSIAYDTALEAIDAPTKEGYTFSGWSELPKTMPAEDVTITGLFILNATQTDEQGLVYTLNESRDAFEVAGYSALTVQDVVIPMTVYELPVTAIRDKALMGADAVNSVIIPASVDKVGEKAFYGCSNLLAVEWNATAPLSANVFDEPSNHGNMLVHVADAATAIGYQGNVVVAGVAEQITLIDGMPLRNTHKFIARHITFTHNFSKKTKIGMSGGWEAMVLPFDVQRVVSEAKGELKPFGEADFDTSLPYWLGELQADGIFAAVQEITANKPFIMQLPNSDEYEDIYNVEGKVTFSATDATVHVTTAMEQEKGVGYSLFGSYEGTVADSYVYALNDDEYTADGEVYMPGGVFVAGSRDIRPFEAYVYSSQAAPAPYLRIGGKGTNGIGHSTLNAKPSTIYDLTGRRVLNTENLKGGIYIMDGRKVVIE